MEDILKIIEQNPNVASTFTAFIAVIISFISILLAIISLWIQRRHNFKSVTPIANIDLSDYENLIEVRIMNSGTGPLIISQVTAETTTGQRAQDLISLMPCIAQYWDTYYQRLENVSIVPSKYITILKLCGDDNDPEFCKTRENIRRHLSKITVTLKYKDIYGRKMPEYHRVLDWFGRHLEETEKRKRANSY